MTKRTDRGAMTFRPLTPETWHDFTSLFGRNGACGGCWCMWWRQTRAEFDRSHGDGNRRAMKRIVDRGEVPGILAYVDGEPVGWCSVAPRERYSSVERSRVLKRLDDKPVWSLVCLFVHKDHRGTGVASSLVAGAVEYARSQGATLVESYPTDPRGRKLEAVSSFMGTPSLFENAGFRECARPSKVRVIMRRRLRRTR
ncbi:MAG: GNAT family N-acetyltransferase [Candidatus Eisenbacteria bacterium]